MLLVLHSDGKTRDTFSVFDHTMIFTAAIHRVHAPVETDCLEPHLMGRENLGYYRKVAHLSKAIRSWKIVNQTQLILSDENKDIWQRRMVSYLVSF